MDIISSTDSHDSPKAVFCDGINANVGCDGGIIRILELYLGRPLQRMICRLHFNELPFKYLFENYRPAIFFK